MFRRNCFCSVINPPVTPPVGKCENCFQIPSLLLMSKDSVPPCADSEGTIDLLENANVEVCKEDNIACTISWSVLSIGSGILSASINSSGILTFKPKVEAQYAGTYHKVVVKAICDCTNDSKIAEINIGIKDLCKDKVCPEDYLCNPCTGDCEEIEEGV